MAVDKEYCMSSYLALRFIERDDADFYLGMKHSSFKPIPIESRVKVETAEDIDEELSKQISFFDHKRKGILLSGGMDSAIVASYLGGSDAYTFRFLGGAFQKAELERAEYYANRYGLKLHYVDIDWKTVDQYLNPVMERKCAPVHSIEPQILQAALQARNDEVEVMFIGESSDLIFGGMDGLLSKDWEFDSFVERYMFTNPAQALVDPVSMLYLFERYRVDGNKIDYISFLNDVFSVESAGSYHNAFSVAGMKYIDPYAGMIMGEDLDLNRVRSGESKYLIRELFSKKYPDIPVPEKNPMPRPVDYYFREWEGPKRSEFRTDLDMSMFSGNQKWQLYCLEVFLNTFE